MTPCHKTPHDLQPYTHVSISIMSGKKSYALETCNKVCKKLIWNLNSRQSIFIFICKTEKKDFFNKDNGDRYLRTYQKMRIIKFYCDMQLSCGATSLFYCWYCYCWENRMHVGNRILRREMEDLAMLLWLFNIWLTAELIPVLVRNDLHLTD